MRLNCARISLGVFTAMGLMAISAAAAPITGTVNWSGTVNATPTTIDFYFMTPGDSTLTINQPLTGSFSGLVPGDKGLIQGLNSTMEPATNPFPGGPLLGWVNLPNGIDFDLHGLNSPPPAICSASITTNCGLVPNSPVVFNQVGNNVFAGFNAFATARNHTSFPTPSDTQFVFGVTTQFTNTTIATLANELATTGHITDSYSITGSGAAVPEPGTTSAMLGGLLVLAGLATRRARRKQ